MRSTTGLRDPRDIEIGAAALAAIEGPLLLFWVVRRHRRRVERTHQRRVDQLAAQARTDTLTRLGNRRAFEDDLGRTIAERGGDGSPFTLLAVDLDGLKRINDRSGPPRRRRADPKGRRLPAEVVGGDGSVYRTGGDEFMVILPGKRNWHGLNLAARIDQETRARTGGRAVSIGLTESIETEGRHLLMNQADIALYEAKRTRLSAVAYHPGLARRSTGTATTCRRTSSARSPRRSHAPSTPRTPAPAAIPRRWRNSVSRSASGSSRPTGLERAPPRGPPSRRRQDRRRRRDPAEARSRSPDERRR